MRSVLFVDDDVKLLEGLRRMLHCLRKQWRMAFVSEGRQALKEMEENQFDVVVTDMRMPGMDGSQLLEEIKTQFPMTVRIVLSGQCDRETILKTIQPAHQFLTKPCDSTVLQTTIDRACHLKDMVADEHVRIEISQLTSLPSTISNYQELCSNINSENAAIEQIAKIISLDVAASAKVLQLVSSGFFGVPQKIISPQHSVMLLGLENIQRLAELPHVFRSATNKDDDAVCQWITEHSLEVAGYARTIAANETSDEGMLIQAYVAGMLHDVGHLINVEEIVDLGEGCAELAYGKNTRISQHPAIGGYLLGLWGLPNAVVDAAAFHHNPLLSADNNFTALTAVHVADALVCEKAGGNISSQRHVDFEYLKRIGCAAKLADWCNLDFSKNKGKVLK